MIRGKNDKKKLFKDAVIKGLRNTGLSISILEIIIVLISHIFTMYQVML